MARYAVRAPVAADCLSLTDAGQVLLAIASPPGECVGELADRVAVRPHRALLERLDAPDLVSFKRKG